jgi:hypothetical protein
MIDFQELKQAQANGEDEAFEVRKVFCPFRRSLRCRKE